MRGLKLLSLDETEEIMKCLAMLAHADQKDKAGVAYESHLRAVVAGCKTQDARIVAWGHDLEEDTHINQVYLRKMGFLHKRHLDALWLLNKHHFDPKNVYEYFQKIKADPIAREVKIADLRHNMDLTRLTDMGIEITEKDIERNKSYQKKLNWLL